ncbi:MAG TPA: phospholipase D family protein [Bacteroidales bacterium]|nr:phospholipase D family protein [Bacteroidales bacterium]HPR12222.1 phospholipase D family protein [Bacteroidales bacterium]HRW85844.1 phospholipase D family protein [Bacteroidales bacterium]
MAKFLSGKELEEGVCDIIYKARTRLLIISPFIRLDEYFRRKVFDKHQGNAELEIVIVFGKNETQINKSFNNQDFEYFKKFPNISIVYAPNLHAKYYANESQSIVTSLNLYDTSFRQNIEFGVISESTLIGSEKIDKDSWTESMNILEKNNVVFVRKPNFKKKLLIGKDYIGSETKYDVTDKLIETGKVPNKSYFDFINPELLDSVKSETRISREEFEKEQLNDKRENQEKFNNGFCIRCKEPIPIDLRSPFCKKCYNEWKVDKNEYNKERFCLICGKPHASSKKYPACHSCYTKHEKAY